MKKILALTLAFAFLAFVSVSAFAADITSNGGEEEIDVQAKYENNVETADVYSVDITWGAMEFTHSVDGSRVWNADEHRYIVSETEAWSASGNTITVVNHSNVSIKAQFTYTADTAHSGVTGTFDKANITLPSAVGVGTDAESLKTVTGTAALTLGGTLANSTTTLTRVGKIKVTISKVN